MSSFVMTSEEWFPSLPFLIGWLVSASCRRRVDLRPWIRVIGVGASILSLGLAWDPALPSLSENGGQVARLLTIAYALISVVGFAAVPQTLRPFFLRVQHAWFCFGWPIRFYSFYSC
jgi:hypothetical protein